MLWSNNVTSGDTLENVETDLQKIAVLFYDVANPLIVLPTNIIITCISVITLKDPYNSTVRRENK